MSKHNDDDMEVDGEEVASENIDNEEVLTKYRVASDVANRAVQAIVKELAVNKSVLELCKLGDQFILNNIKKSYKKLDKGVAFPTSISVNEVVCHNSPMNDDKQVLKLGDTVRIDLGVHLDGYIAVAGHTVVLKKETITGQEADAMAAVECGLQVALRLMKPGKKNTEVSKALRAVAENYGVNLCEGVLSHQMSRYVIDGSQTILLKPTPEQTVQEFEFQANEVYSLDIVVSTGPGKLREIEPSTTIYKRNPQNNFNLKLRSSRQVLKDMQKFNNLAFNLRDLDPKVARIGIAECYRNGLVDAYPVLCERSGKFVAQIKVTVLIQSRQVSATTGQKFQSYSTDKKLENKDLQNLLKTSLKIKKRKNKKKK